MILHAGYLKCNVKIIFIVDGLYLYYIANLAILFF